MVEVKTVKMRRSWRGQITLSRPTESGSERRISTKQTFNKAAGTVSHDPGKSDKGDERENVHDDSDVFDEKIDRIEHILDVGEAGCCLEGFRSPAASIK